MKSERNTIAFGQYKKLATQWLYDPINELYTTYMIFGMDF
jgi:hypothetical protein